jgi:murein DD-endopeptidase MepM/ murein hydrolase activator NlpD
MPHRLFAAFVAALVFLLLSVSLASAHWPVASRSSHVTQWYHRSHPAIDIGARLGTPILAAESGRVVFAGWKRNGGGWQVWTRSSRTGRDLYVIYAHMRYRPTLVVGQWVATGRWLGRVGSTGRSTGPHLHIAMWRGYPWQSGSYPVNPWSRLTHGYWLPVAYR